MNDYNFKPFDKVLVRIEGYDKWIVSFYSHYDKEENVHVLTNGVLCVDCIPYEGNEPLLGTTNVPKPKRWRAKDEEYYYFVDAAFNSRSEREIDSSIDSFRYEIGNYFRTREEADQMADKFKAMLKGERE